ncbi:hypothetical protein PIB30_109393, partial [Stylosanthes scabra]|nr:hypothetical protein [Stylosanthes scabra]
RRMRVGTRTTARDWQWVNQAMEEDGEFDVAPQRVRRVAEEDRGGAGGGDEAAGGPDVPHTPGASTQGYVDETQQFFGSPGGLFFDGVLSPASLEQQFGAEGAYYADLARCLQGSPQGALGRSSSQAQGRTHVDLNQPASDPFVDSSFALGGTPPSAFVDGPSHMDADDQAPPAAEDPEPRRGRRAVRRRGCGMGGH